MSCTFAHRSHSAGDERVNRKATARKRENVGEEGGLLEGVCKDMREEGYEGKSVRKWYVRGCVREMCISA